MTISQHLLKSTFRNSSMPRSLTSITVSTLLTLSASFSTNPTINMSQISSSSTPLKSTTTPESSSTTTTTQTTSSLSPLLTNHLNLSWITQLSPENPTQDPPKNKSSRRVKNGHYVLVPPTPIPNPRLVAHSPTLISELGLSEDDVSSNAFLRYFSGDTPDATTWATPYALSIMGTRYTSNCPFRTGEGYGDGRAVSVAEVWIPSSEQATKETDGQRYEFQLKGAGRTPFCRGADGRAVLRSSIREFLASEAMHFLGVSTTRALSLIVSDGGTTQRPWYRESLVDGSSGGGAPSLPSLDDPRLAMYPLEKRRQIIAALKNQKRDPDVMIEEPLAITTRVAGSFTRIGHVDLFSRRAEKAALEGRFEGVEYEQLEEILWHAAYREFYDVAYEPFREGEDLEGCVVAMLEGSAEGIAKMVAGWVRVGFAQGNFNGDNCLIAGRTMDYGPFGFMDEYNPLFAKWTGSGEHFGFLNQPTAGLVNYIVLVESALQVFKRGGANDDEIAKNDDKVEELQKRLIERAKTIFEKEVNAVWNVKMGFSPDSDEGPLLWDSLEPLLRDTRADWTLFWRQLSYVAADFALDDTSYDKMFDRLVNNNQYSLSSPFHDPLSPGQKKTVIQWIQSWREALRKSAKHEENGNNGITPAERMLKSNPKYTLREWMLVDAYTQAANGNEDIIHELNQLIQNPYTDDEKDKSSDNSMEKKYYRRALEDDLTKGGTAFMS